VDGWIGRKEDGFLQLQQHGSNPTVYQSMTVEQYKSVPYSLYT